MAFLALLLMIWAHVCCAENPIERASIWEPTLASSVPAASVPVANVYSGTTSSWQSTWVATSTSTWVGVVTQQNVVVTLTSYIPCPTTSTTWVYECTACPQTTQQQPAVAVGTTTETLYTDAGAASSIHYTTFTSGDYVVVVGNPTAAAATTSATGLTQVQAGSASSIETDFPLNIWMTTVIAMLILVVIV